LVDVCAPFRYSLLMATSVKNPALQPETTKISSKHQITIGRRAFAQAGLAAGDVVQVRAVGAGKVLLDRTDEIVERYSGALSSGGALRRQLDELRDEWE
jgi:bifunctional DNA-binding transcriptional regulator/antitoxin component of YhaV-PrlF toxin-antitoxin module